MKLTPEERETHLYQSDADKIWRAWSESPRFQRLLARKGYKRGKDGEYPLGAKAITLRSQNSITRKSPGSNLVGLAKAREGKKKAAKRAAP